MKIKRSRRAVIALTLFCVLGACGVAGASAGPATPPPPAECEGDAYPQVAVSFDEAKGQYRARNNSADRRARVTAANVASAASVCLAPGQAAHLALRSIVGPYRATYAAARCGEGEAGGAPPGGV